MNWLDLILIAIIIILLVVGIVMIVLAIVKRNDFSSDIGVLTIGYWICLLVFGWLLVLPFIVLDNGAGSTIGTITSVDKNFFGTTAVYVKTSETTQEELCIEDNELSETAKSLIGKEVKVSYGTRVGLYSTGKCGQAPIEKIEVVTND